MACSDVTHDFGGLEAIELCSCPMYRKGCAWCEQLCHRCTNAAFAVNSNLATFNRGFSLMCFAMSCYIYTADA